MLQMLFATAVTGFFASCVAAVFVLDDDEWKRMRPTNWLQLVALIAVVSLIGGVIHGGIAFAWNSIGG